MNVRTSNYLNNLIEQDHGRVKQRIDPMLGCKNVGTATVTMSVVELAQKIRKSQGKTEQATSAVTARAPRMWEAVLAACCQTERSIRVSILPYLP
jgi:transposase-like protein